MDKEWFELFSDRNYWENLVQTYIRTGAAPGKLPLSHVEDLWDYFKFCLLTDNRFFFDHPLLGIMKTKIGEHVVSLPSKSILFRARVDSNNLLRDQAQNLSQANLLTNLKEKMDIPDGAEYDKTIAQFTEADGYDTYRSQYQSGFEGFPSAECLAPPAHKVSNGRCNMPFSPHLYAAADIHTAIAETRPYRFDTVSVASLCCEKDLKIVDFCYDLKDLTSFNDRFYLAMSADFSAVNKGNENDYFATQYLTLLVKSLGYDGLMFKSSLIIDGVNYVIFDNASCRPLSSKLYTIAQVHYDVLPVTIGTHLKNSSGANIDDPRSPC